MSAERIWRPEFVILLVIVHFLFIGNYALFVLLPTYLEDSSKTVIGIVVGLFGLSAVLMRLWAGSLTDLFGRRLLFLTGLAIAALSLFLYAQGPYPAGLIPVRILHGLAWALMGASWPALAADLVPPSRRGEAIGLPLLATEGAALYAPFVWLALAEGVSFRLAYVTLGLLVVIGFITIARFPSDRPQIERWSLPKPFLPARAALLPLVGFLGAAVALGVLAAFLAIHVDDEDLGSPQLFFLASGFTAIASAFLVGRVERALGYRVTAFLSLLLVGGAMLIVALATSGVQLIPAGALFGAGFTGAYTAGGRMAYESAPPMGRALALATVYLGFDLGRAAAIPFGALADASGTSTVFAVAAAIAAGGAVILLVTGRRRTALEPREP